MNVLVVCSQKYHDMDAVRRRLVKGLATEHKTWIRKNDRTLGPLLKGLGLEVEQYESKFGFKDEAYKSELLAAMDYVIVYGKSTTTQFFIDKASGYPYDIIFGKKVEVNA